jgi:hypothetical protein
MRLSHKSHTQLESFFRDYYDDAELKLPEIRIFSKRAARLITKSNHVYAITFGRFIFVKPDILTRDSNDELYVSKELMAHEITHVLQYQKLGWLKFFYTYLSGYWKNLSKKEKWDFRARTEAYLEIPHEIEARFCATKFLEWKLTNGEL